MSRGARRSSSGTAVAATAPVAGRRHRHRHQAPAEQRPVGVHEDPAPRTRGFFESEAAGLRWLGEAGGIRVPEVLAVEPDCLILAWVEPGKLTTEAASEFGRALAKTHDTGAPSYGLDRDGFIGRLPMPNKPAADLGGVLRHQDGSCPTSSWPSTAARSRPRAPSYVEAVVGRLADLVPEEGPRRLHGDLWNGNVIWTHDGGCCVIDPAAHGGHRETDLAMLALFGLPHLPRVLLAYEEVSPLGRRLGGPRRPPPALPAAGARVPLRRRVRRPRGRGREPASAESRPRSAAAPIPCRAAPGPLGARVASQARLRTGWHSRAVTPPATPLERHQAARARRRRRQGGPRVAAPQPGVQRVRRLAGRRRRRGAGRHRAASLPTWS